MSDVVYPNRRYVVGGRNGYNAIDEYTVKGCMRLVDTFKSKKEAGQVAMNLGCAHADGMRDALVGLSLPLVRDVEHRTYRPTSSVTVIPAGTVVKVLKRDSAAWFTCTTGTVEFDCQYSDLREPLPE